METMNPLMTEAPERVEENRHEREETSEPVAGARREAIEPADLRTLEIYMGGGSY